ncbi:hypothetical protein NDU88_002838 [Pleurodeles waltl]|uniref:Uncharacterized protein n=1 Tax=Pleurodeles waltl TaxID=8319 RepID=A0AAV7LDI4_PLEWA|nr:hypothetical protein NDU88_002838 [Pleurodeles waltl]
MRWRLEALLVVEPVVEPGAGPAECGLEYGGGPQRLPGAVRSSGGGDPGAGVLPTLAIDCTTFGGEEEE